LITIAQVRNRRILAALHQPGSGEHANSAAFGGADGVGSTRAWGVTYELVLELKLDPVKTERTWGRRNPSNA